MESQTTEEKIITSALEEFAEHGYEGARVDRIAERAGVNKAMIYYHYKGKENLYEKIIRDTATGIRAYIQERMIPDVNSLDDVIAMFSFFADYLHGLDLNFFRILMREISSGGKYLRDVFLPNTLLPFMSVYVEAAKKLKEEGKIKDVDPVYTFLQLAGSILYFNLLRIVLRDSQAFSLVFRENYLADFKKNFSLIVREGIANGKGKGEV
ncbi:MAG: TetR/AcrR family transcriptional regulator [Spirochaetes bacterium]|nr:TetR/AcrR family transcriptional regulator [Spirochaetota bacterium]